MPGNLTVEFLGESLVVLLAEGLVELGKTGTGTDHFDAELLVLGL